MFELNTTSVTAENWRCQIILEENVNRVEETDNVRLRTVHMTGGIPDALYMVHDHGSPRAGGMYGGGMSPLHRLNDGSLATSSVDIIAGTIPGLWNLEWLCSTLY